tara:strand:+ start:272 stop:487 length:216 start_codon:yes stop_codon:yes gene_type:complete
MDMIVSFHLLKKYNQEYKEELNPSISSVRKDRELKDLNIPSTPITSPTKSIVCDKCGQLPFWCSCHLHDKI